MLEAVKRGVKVALVLDRTETVGQQARLHDTLEKAGCDVRLISPRKGTMHNKYIIVDGKTVEWGSYNYTERAENKNFENATFATDGNLAQQYHLISYLSSTKHAGITRRQTYDERFLRHLVERRYESEWYCWARLPSVANVAFRILVFRPFCIVVASPFHRLPIHNNVLVMHCTYAEK